MATLRDIKERIVSVQSTRQITRTMEMVATAKIRRAQDRIENARPYAFALADVLGNVVRYVPDLKHPLLEVHPERKRVVYIADRLGSRPCRRVQHQHHPHGRSGARQEAEAGVEVELITSGKKALTYFRYRGLEPQLALRDMSDKPDFSHAREISDWLIERYTSGEIDGAYILFNRFKNVAEQSPETHQLLPIESSVLKARRKRSRSAASTWSTSSSRHRPRCSRTCCRTTSRRWCTGDCSRVAASEQGARRTAMKSATDNASEMITTLTRSYNRARQAAITTEIAEIVGGSAALEEE